MHFLLLVLFTGGPSFACNTMRSGSHKIELKDFKDAGRWFMLFVPKGLRIMEARPAVINFHPKGWTPMKQDLYTRMSLHAETHKWFAVHPQVRRSAICSSVPVQDDFLRSVQSRLLTSAWRYRVTTETRSISMDGTEGAAVESRTKMMSRSHAQL